MSAPIWPPEVWCVACAHWRKVWQEVIDGEMQGYGKCLWLQPIRGNRPMTPFDHGCRAWEEKKG